MRVSSFNFKRFFSHFDKLLKRMLKIQIYPLRIDFRPIRTPKDRSIGLYGILHNFFKLGQEGVWGRTTTPSPYRSMINNLKLVSWQIALRQKKGKKRFLPLRNPIKMGVFFFHKCRKMSNRKSDFKVLYLFCTKKKSTKFYFLSVVILHKWRFFIIFFIFLFGELLLHFYEGAF